MKKMMVFLSLLRAKQWIKNVFVLMPLIFGRLLFNVTDVLNALIAFAAFCLLTSGLYIINDIRDLKSDRLHPQKKNRPLAAGLIKARHAALIAIILLAISLSVGFVIGRKILLVMVLYAALHLLYTFALKMTVILDVISIALGFEMRVWAGSLAIDIHPSIWLQLCVFLLALFLGFIKRRHEKIILYDKAVEHRGVLAHYTSYFLDQMIMISATLCVIFYGLYTMSEDVARQLGNNYMAYTIPFVIYGVFRYLYLVYVKKIGDDAGEILISDLPFFINIALWFFSVVFIIYYLR